MADVKATVAQYRTKAEEAFNTVKTQATDSSSEVANVAKQAFAELRNTAEQLANAVKGTAQEQLKAAKAGGDLKAQFNSQKSLVSNYAEPLKTAGNSIANIAGDVKNGLVAVAK